MKKTLFFAASAVAALSLAACSSSGNAVGETETEIDVAQSDVAQSVVAQSGDAAVSAFIVSTVIDANGNTIEADPASSLMIIEDLRSTDEIASFNFGCNTMSSGIASDGALGAVGMTQMYCEDVPNEMDIAAILDGATLVVSEDGEAVEVAGPNGTISFESEVSK